MPEFIGQEEAGLDGGPLGGQCGVGVGVGECGGTWEYFPLLIFCVFKTYLFSYSAHFDSSSDPHHLML